MEENKKPNKTKNAIIYGILFLMLVLLTSNINILHLFNQTKASSKANIKPTISAQQKAQEAQQTEANNIKAVVHIACDNGLAGSGTIWTKSGLILTNNHVITGSTYCLVTLPDPTTGSPMSIYTAEPLIDPNLSQLYDLAALQITGSYTDSNRKIWGSYPTTFPAFTKPVSCTDNDPHLGDNIRIYGYPVTSGDYNLTVTQGIISNFSDNGNILTSAQVDSGNSGGLAVNLQNGCMVGIPSAVEEGNYQNLGVIIPLSVIADFIEKAANQTTPSAISQTPTQQPQPSTNTQSTQYVVSDSSWKFSTSAPPTWLDANFDDSSWESTQAPSDGQCPANVIISSSWINENGTLPMSVSSPNWTGETGYFRKTFNISFAPSSATLKTLIDYDGSVYINGNEVYSTTSSPDNGIQTTNIDPSVFIQGTNVINVVDNGTGECQGSQVELSINP